MMLFVSTSPPSIVTITLREIMQRGNFAQLLSDKIGVWTEAVSRIKTARHSSIVHSSRIINEYLWPMFFYFSVCSISFGFDPIAPALLSSGCFTMPPDTPSPGAEAR